MVSVGSGAPVQGLSVAYVVARHCEVPMIFARHLASMFPGRADMASLLAPLHSGPRDSKQDSTRYWCPPHHERPENSECAGQAPKQLVAFDLVFQGA